MMMAGITIDYYNALQSRVIIVVSMFAMTAILMLLTCMLHARAAHDAQSIAKI